MLAALPDAVVSLVVSVDANNSVTTTGICPVYTMLRATARGGIRTNTDARIYILADSLFSNITDIVELKCKVENLAGETIKIGTGEYAQSHRITAATLLGCKGIVIMQIGEYDRVVQ